MFLIFSLSTGQLFELFELAMINRRCTLCVQILYLFLLHFCLGCFPHILLRGHDYVIGLHPISYIINCILILNGPQFILIYYLKGLMCFNFCLEIHLPHRMIFLS